MILSIEDLSGFALKINFFSD